MIVHFKTALVPRGTPVTVEVDNDGLAIVAVPLKTLHNPEPTDGVLPANVKVPELQFVWAGPAFEVVGNALIVIAPAAFELTCGVHAPPEVNIL